MKVKCSSTLRMLMGLVEYFSTREARIVEMHTFMKGGLLMVFLKVLGER